MSEPVVGYEVDEPPLILALDASTRTVGWSAGRRADALTSGVYVPQGSDVWERVEDIYWWLTCKVGETGASILGYEEPHGAHGNADTDRKLGVVMGIALAVAAEHGCQFLRVHNAVVKATGCCKDTIPVVERLIGRRLSERHAGDEADAIGVWLATETILRLREAEATVGG